MIPPSCAGLRRGRSYDTHPDPRQFLQHTCSQSVARNTSFILFHCGNYDRFGVRHRETQTLCLSDLIDVKHCKDPAYGKLQVGLYSAAMQDAKERLTHVKEPTEVKAASKTRRLPDGMKQSTKRGNKRCRINANQPGKGDDESDDGSNREKTKWRTYDVACREPDNLRRPATSLAMTCRYPLSCSAISSRPFAFCSLFLLYLLYFMVDMAHLKEWWVDISLTP
ncbi:hypothetical protein K443DRAFT_431702 [Laccaria amethystina LaAM-08-1]|uniref:Unplaced genomic scaffold K443scaffold_37, whole genome shotgun sequence n=1 Tax=Laccaria amethystina LaAM-08-1 TaxID=1095629 RepID=A0A0C9Y7Z8_9AGAR|nr:hypothetical protein K443DRAFT_431702 [Laccaria amethystina LaAM-08-1]